MWKIGLVGAGYWSRNHLLAWASHPGAAVSAICDPDDKRRASRGDEFGIPEERRFGTMEEMLDRADIDVVDIITPPATHPALVEAAARAGKQILCIKPFAESLAEARGMLSVVEQSGVRAMVTENWRWYAPIRRLKQLLDEGRVGTPFYARYANLIYASPRMSDEREMSQPFFRTMPRLLFYEMGVHWLDVWRFLFGEPGRLYAEMRRISPYVIGEDLGTLSVARDDFLGLLEMSWASRTALAAGEPRAEKMVIEGDRATVTMEDGGPLRLIDSVGATETLEEEVRYDTVESIRALQAHFIRGLEEGKRFETDIPDNIKTLELVFSAYESAQSHRAVILPAGRTPGP